MKCEKCGGSGWIEYKDDNGNWKAKQCECVEQQIINDLINASGIPKGYINKTVAQYNTEDDLASKVKKSVTTYVNGFEKMRDTGKGLYIYSETKGTGKTHLACSLGMAIMRMYKAGVRFVTLSDLFMDIKNSFGNDTANTVDGYRDIELLIIDDLGVEKVSEWNTEMLFNIIDYREKNVLPIVFTSNCKIDELKYDDRIKSRIAGHSIEVQAPNKDKRRV